MNENEPIKLPVGSVFSIPWGMQHQSKPIESFKLSEYPKALPAKGFAHLWFIDLLSSDLSDYASILTTNERSKLALLKQAEAQQFRLRARVALKLILSIYLKIAPAQVKIIYGKEGKPFLDPTHDPSFFFNVSHSQHYLVVLIDPQQANGIDIEWMGQSAEMISSMAKRFFYTSESEGLFKSNAAEQVALFNRIWTTKEAMLKSEGLGVFAILQTPNVEKLVQDHPDQVVQFFQLERYNGFSFKYQGYYITAISIR